MNTMKMTTISIFSCKNPDLCFFFPTLPLWFVCAAIWMCEIRFNWQWSAVITHAQPSALQHHPHYNILIIYLVNYPCLYSLWLSPISFSKPFFPWIFHDQLSYSMTEVKVINSNQNNGCFDFFLSHANISFFNIMTYFAFRLKFLIKVP